MVRRASKHHSTPRSTFKHSYTPPAADTAPRSRQDNRQWHTGSAEWLRIRERVLRRDAYTCALCGDNGNEVDHVNENAFDNRDENLQTLCARCHGRKTRTVQSAQTAALPVLAMPSRIPVTVLCGPAGSGRVTHVLTESGDSGLLIDVDCVRARLAGLHPVQQRFDARAGKVKVTDAIVARNKMLTGLATETHAQRAYVVVGAPRRSERTQWQQQLGPLATVVVLAVPADVCLERIALDPARAQYTSEHWRRVVCQWWDAYVPD